MSRTASPLRYPGGKSCMLDVVSQLLRENKLERRQYAEPYAGGCGLALSLLFGGHVSELHLNDVDLSIWSFWWSVLEQNDAFLELIKNTPITVDEWERQKQIHSDLDPGDPLKLGFATFFLNRTNRSGIIKGAGMIGGHAQKGKYKLDCRFNRENLSRRIRRIGRHRDRIHLYRYDALEFLDIVEAELPASTFLCIDPPYFAKGSKLYTSYYHPDDHSSLSHRVLTMKNPWILTYDNEPTIRELYTSRRQFEFDINYSVETKRVGTELMVVSKGMRVPQALRNRQLPKMATKTSKNPHHTAIV